MIDINKISKATKKDARLFNASTLELGVLMDFIKDFSHYTKRVELVMDQENVMYARTDHEDERIMASHYWKGWRSGRRA